LFFGQLLCNQAEEDKPLFFSRTNRHKYTLLLNHRHQLIVSIETFGTTMISRNIHFFTAAAALVATATGVHAFTTSTRCVPSNHHHTITSTSLFSTTAQEQEQQLFYAAAGSPSVDMNRYNLPLTACIENWTAVLQAETSMQSAGIFLKAKDSELFVDTLKYTIKRSGGLGLLLLELAGGREDGIGITIIEDLVDSGNAHGSGIQPGDSIVGLTVTKNVNNGMNVEEERVSVSTECLSYDGTIEALLSLPEVVSEEDEVILTVKRLRRQPKISVKLQYPPADNVPDACIELFAGENLRRALLTRGIKLNDKLAERFDSGGRGDCGADGTCATCVVSVSKGMDLLSPMKQQEEQILKQKPRWRMACKTVVGFGMTEGDLTIQVSPRQWEI
jgi:ferredoxin